MGYSTAVQVGITLGCAFGLIAILFLGGLLLICLGRQVERETNFGPAIHHSYVEKGWATPLVTGPRQPRPGRWLGLDEGVDSESDGRRSGDGEGGGAVAGGSGTRQGREGAPLGERVTSETTLTD